MADVFISYHRSEGTSELVRRIAENLNGKGISCWYDTQEYLLGDFLQRIVYEIEICKVFLFIWDEGSNGPGFAYNETLQAFKRYNKEKQPVIVPFKMGQFEMYSQLELLLSPFNAFNGGELIDNTHIEELVAKIADKLGWKAPVIPQYGKCGYNNVVRWDENGYIANCKDNATYVLDENGILTISGTGRIWTIPTMALSRSELFDRINHSQPNVLWKNISSLILSVHIKDGINSLGHLTFAECNNLTNVVMSDSVTSIGFGAFAHCVRLTHIVISKKVNSIPHGTFAGCSSLKDITIPDSVTTIGELAFYDCINLDSIIMPDSITHIKAWAFAGCKQLTNVKISNNVTYIERHAFQNCVNLTDITIPDSVNEIHQAAFQGCYSLKRASVPANAQIALGAFPDTTKIIRRE